MAEEERGQERGSHEGENLRGEGKAPLERLSLFPWVVFLVHSSNVIAQNSEPEKCYLTKSTIGSLLSEYKHQPFPPSQKTYYKSSVPEKCYPTNRTIISLSAQKQTSHYTYAVACTYILNNVTCFSRHIKQIDNLDPLSIRHSDRLTRTAPGNVLIIIAHTAVRKLHHSRITLFHALLGIL